MPNQFTTVTTQGYGSRIMGAIVGVPIGLLIIVVSIGVLYWNEGRVDLSKIAQKSTPINPIEVDKSANGTFASVTGPTGTTQAIGDGSYLKPGAYVAVQRVVEEYAWVEDQNSQSHSNVGGSQTTTTTYTYKQEWTDNVADSSGFHDPTGHQNPAKPIDDTTAKATTATVGVYSIDPQTISLPSLQPVNLTTANTILSPTATSNPSEAPAAPATAPTSAASTAPAVTPLTVSLSNLALASSSYLFTGAGSLGAPQVGDIRISYLALPAGTTVTVFGLVNGTSIARYTNSQNNSLYNLLYGDRNTAIATLHNQYETLTWILRVGGIIALWIGLMMLMGPLNVLLDFLPIAGEISGVLTLIITLPLALLIGITVILISYTVHHVIALIIGVPLVFALGLGVFKLIKHSRGIPVRPAATPALAVPSTMPMSPAAGPVPGGSSGSLFPAAQPPSPAPETPGFPAVPTPGLVSPSPMPVVPLPIPPPAQPTMPTPPPPPPPSIPPNPNPNPVPEATPPSDPLFPPPTG